MRRIACALSIIAWSSAAVAEPARYLTGQEILGSFTGHTMLWEDYRSPDKVPAIVHYAGGNEIDILYGGQLVPNRFRFDYGDQAICWTRQTTTCRSFFYDGAAHVFVVDPANPGERLAEVTRITPDANHAIFAGIAKAETEDSHPPAVAEASPPPSSRADSSPHMSPGDALVMALIFGMLEDSFSGNGSSGSSEFRFSDGRTVNESTAHFIEQRREEQRQRE